MGSMNASLVRQIEKIRHFNLPDLEDKFEEIYGFKAGRTSVRNLRKRIAYRLQEIYIGGLSDADKQILNDLADKDPLANLEISKKSKVSNQTGTRFNRVWKGVEHEVTVQEDGKFEYNGKSYKSLSAIAREITGTRWNGKLFFGVK